MTTTTPARVTVITDDERPLVLYGERDRETLAGGDAAAHERRRPAQGRGVMIALLLEPFGYQYMVKAIWVSALVGGVCAFLSCYLMLKGWSLMGDALAHAIVPGVALAYLLKVPYAAGAFFSGLLAALAMALVRDAHAIARGCGHRHRLHHLLRHRPADRLDQPDLGQRAVDRARQHPRHLRRGCRPGRDHRGRLARDPAAALEGPACWSSSTRTRRGPSGCRRRG